MQELQPIFNNLPSLSVALNLVYYCLLGLFAILTAVIYFHWTTYATDKAATRITMLIYMVCTLPLLLIMAVILFIV